jgi:HEAT repeat protein
MVRDPDSKVRLAAAIALLDRGFGRPKQEIETSGNATIELHLVAARVISQELLATADAPPTIEHTVTPSDTLDTPTE